MANAARTNQLTIVPADEASWDDLQAIFVELHVGTVGMFARAGFAEVSRPTLRRVVMRIDFKAV